MHPVQALFGPAVRQPDPDDYSSTRGRELADQRYKVRICPCFLVLMGDEKADDPLVDYHRPRRRREHPYSIEGGPGHC